MPSLPTICPRVPTQMFLPGLGANICSCQKALGWLLVPPAVLLPGIVYVLSSTYREAMKSSLYLSLSSLPSLPAHLTPAFPPPGTVRASLFSPPPPRHNRCRTSFQTGGWGLQQGRGTTKEVRSAACQELSG